MAVNSLGYQINKQPIAQSFYVDKTSGIYCTKVDLFFANVDEALPVQVQLRPMQNGLPSSSQIIPGTVKLVTGLTNASNSSADASVATSFQFDEPVFLKGKQDYALVVTADSKDYRIYVSETEEFVIGSTEKRINKQPSLGSLFFTQNGVTFTPSQSLDLAFRIYQANFTATSGTAVFHNAPLPPRLLRNDPITVTKNSAKVTVRETGSGLLPGDTVKITGATALGGINAATLNKDSGYTVDSVDWSGFTFTADSSADSAAIGGGGLVKATTNMPFSVIHPNIINLVPNRTALSGSIKVTNSTSFAQIGTNMPKANGAEVAYTGKSTASFQDIKMNEDNIGSVYNVVANVDREATLGGGVKSMDLSFNLSTTDSNVSPMIDLQRASIHLIQNIIDRQDSNGHQIADFNKPLTFVNETASKRGSAAAKHYTRVVTLDTDSVGIRVLLTANRPEGTDFQVYYRTATADEVIGDKNFILQPEETNNPADNSLKRFREYRYLIGGLNGSVKAFTKFQIKIVFRSITSARVPKIKDLRMIALTV
tara:strand:- start:4030 stop:5646 length:1617 start_codon:yes stop_codon:yes gene_type:complete